MCTSPHILSKVAAPAVASVTSPTFAFGAKPVLGDGSLAAAATATAAAATAAQDRRKVTAKRPSSSTTSIQDNGVFWGRTDAGDIMFSSNPFTPDGAVTAGGRTLGDGG